MLTATRREWSEIYTLFRILADGKLACGDASGRPTERMLPVSRVEREEHDGRRSYVIGDSEVRLLGNGLDQAFPREDFAVAADKILGMLKGQNLDVLESPEEIELFLEVLQIDDFEAFTDDRTDLHLVFYDESFPPMGFRIYSRFCAMFPLLDGGRTANLKYEQSGVRFSQPAVNKINYTDDPSNANEVARRMLYIESLGGILKYNDVADKIFRSNLSMIDLHFPRVLAEMVRLLHLDNISKISELTELIEERNPLKIKEELIRKHGFYRYKMKEFLLALAFGMRPAKQYNGKSSAVQGFLMVDAEGCPVCYQSMDREVFADFLYANTRLEKGDPEKDKYGLLERENRQYYLKLNLKVGFVKR